MVVKELGMTLWLNNNDGRGRCMWPEKLASVSSWSSTDLVPCTVQSLGRGWGSSRSPKPSRLKMSSEWGAEHTSPKGTSLTAPEQRCITIRNLPCAKEVSLAIEQDSRSRGMAQISLPGSNLWNNQCTESLPSYVKCTENQADAEFQQAGKRTYFFPP